MSSEKISQPSKCIGSSVSEGGRHTKHRTAHKSIARQTVNDVILTDTTSNKADVSLISPELQWRRKVFKSEGPSPQVTYEVRSERPMSQRYMLTPLGSKRLDDAILLIYSSVLKLFEIQYHIIGEY